MFQHIENGFWYESKEACFITDLIGNYTSSKHWASINQAIPKSPKPCAALVQTKRTISGFHHSSFRNLRLTYSAILKNVEVMQKTFRGESKALIAIAVLSTIYSMLSRPFAASSTRFYSDIPQQMINLALENNKQQVFKV